MVGQIASYKKGAMMLSTKKLMYYIAEEFPTLKLEIASFNSLPQTVTDSRIKANQVVVNSELGTPSAQTSDWTVTTSAGSLTISGTISGSTTCTLYLSNSK